MYIEELHYINMGPIERADITLMRADETTPRPVVLVGKNGSGKSILLSNIIDCFYEIAGKAYENVLQYKGNGGHLFYKIISPNQIKLGQNELFAHIKFRQEEHYEYISKISKLSKEEYSDKYGILVDDSIQWNPKESEKIVSIPKGKIPDIFDKDIICYFAPSRFMYPEWIGELYTNHSTEYHFSVREHFERQLRNPIEVSNDVDSLLQWIFDVIVDAKPEIEKTPEGPNDYRITYPTNGLDALMIAKDNIERVVSEILGEEIILRMLNRSQGESRLAIIRKKDRQRIVPSLESLSTGQLALLNIFASIIRYADVDDINYSLRLQDIKGIVVIDEVELHLHSQLQREVIPRLIKMFPLVQFIITSHSPLFLLGMREEFGEDGFDIYEMPDARKISAEQFSEFENAYRYFQDTNRFQNELRKAIDQKTERTLIITEGATDWRHMKAAQQVLAETDPELNWLNDADFEYLKYDPKNSNSDNPIKIEMGISELPKMAKEFSKIRQVRKIILIADRDVKNDVIQLTGDLPYKDWGNNVYAVCLPVPEHRRTTPDICIEHYYQDEELKREVLLKDGIARRIYIGNEFDAHGRSLANGKFCTNPKSCGENKINIIDGNDNNKVYDINPGTETNYALPKMVFAEKVLLKEKPFEHMNFASFKILFTIIKDILDRPLV